MASLAVEPRLSPEAYLERERKADTKSEYFNGRVYAMSGASREHNLVRGNFAVEVGRCLRDRHCEAYIADMRVGIEPAGAYVYPDVVIVCGEPQFLDTGLDTLLNPTVLVEILSPSTESGDRGHKAAHYRSLPSLQEYILVAQDRPQVERFVRQANGWLLTEYSGLDATLPLTAIGCDVPLHEIYAKVVFPPQETI